MKPRCPFFGLYRLLLVVCLVLLAACGGGRSAANATSAAPEQPSQPIALGGWEPLKKRLAADNITGPEVDRFFAQLPPYNPAPMSAKIKELFAITFQRDPNRPKPPPVPESVRKSRVYKGLVTQATVDKCRAFLEEHKATFINMEKTYGVPKETVAALLYVETRLGTYVGNDNALLILASMADSIQPEKVRPALYEVPLTQEHDSWLRTKLQERSTWAYKELKALLTYCTANHVDPVIMPGSMYGAIGICQFMPSNISLFGVDGNKNGKIDLFEPADAIHSVGNYLAGSGWKGKQDGDEERKVLRRYNNLTIYANSIMALAASVRTGVLHSAPPDMAQAKKTATPAKTKAPAKAPAKAEAPKKASPAAGNNGAKGAAKSSMGSKPASVATAP
ncbi:lytic murein transglycosylase [Desulfovibrio cuneatus]|uniref:lytic murein transglycosylase n=1 Tax=Desulfovibrio cuneatus TaxID=159728 RepID=UPI00042A6131|nr:lytic murein transglycosylase [Desulfovibrio cuneatus]